MGAAHMCYLAPGKHSTRRGQTLAHSLAQKACCSRTTYVVLKFLNMPAKVSEVHNLLGYSPFVSSSSKGLSSLAACHAQITYMHLAKLQGRGNAGFTSRESASSKQPEPLDQGVKGKTLLSPLLPLNRLTLVSMGMCALFSSFLSKQKLRSSSPL